MFISKLIVNWRHQGSLVTILKKVYENIHPLDINGYYMQGWTVVSQLGRASSDANLKFSYFSFSSQYLQSTNDQTKLSTFVFFFLFVSRFGFFKPRSPCLPQPYDGSLFVHVDEACIGSDLGPDVHAWGHQKSGEYFWTYHSYSDLLSCLNTAWWDMTTYFCHFTMSFDSLLFPRGSIGLKSA